MPNPNVVGRYRFSLFLSLSERLSVQLKSKQQLYEIHLLFKHEITRTVKVKAASREVAEERALKRNPTAISVKRHS